MSRYMKPGNGNQQANHKLAMDWFLDKLPGSIRLDKDHVSLEGETYRVTCTVEQDSLFLSQTERGERRNDLPARLKGVHLLALRQLKTDGRLVGYTFKDTQALWDARIRGGAAALWEDAKYLAERRPIVELTAAK